MIIRATGKLFFSLSLAAALSSASCATGEASFEDVTHAAADDAAARFAGIPQKGETLGDPAAPITLTVFSDLRCSHCRDFEVSSLPLIVDRYVRPGKLRVVLHNLPILGAPSVRAAEIAVAVGEQGKMFQLLDVFFQRAPGPVDDALLRRIAGSIPGLDVDRAFAAASSPSVAATLAEARRLADSFHVRGTPTFVLAKGSDAGHVIRARPALPETFTAPIDALLAE